ncbi:class I SAM-dependent methyltransferase [Aquabacterium sp.]|uniref:class I SAM-dependent methyltransferase n=1 Tax=Aquabacterium sp. TaxID=1872578 RepID=UPI002C3A9E07|nr:class I SAM-dependent methyltransferase [Aquabacterium sp.]HSW05208.1 class I SAM-dependent methyltransferase [Aquabacterium sp.]
MSFSERQHALGYICADPTPSPEELSAFYAESYYQQHHGSYRPDYPEDEHRYYFNVARAADATARRLGLPRSAFDIGCGEGFFAAGLQRLGWQMRCCDYSSHGIDTFNPQLRDCFVQGDAYALVAEGAAAGQQYGLIDLQNVLEHVIDPVGILKALKPLVADGGALRVRVPNDYSRFQQLLLERGITRNTWFAPPQHLNYFNRDSLRQLFAHCDYEVLDCQADFPIELFLTHPGSNYWADRSLGKAAHASRVMVENFLIEEDIEAYLDYASAAARLGFGRELIAYVRPRN